MEYNSYTTDDFLNDESFQSFALGLSQEDESYWKAWIEKYPEKRREFDEALQALQSFSIRSVHIHPDKKSTDLKRLEAAIGEAKVIRLSSTSRIRKILLKIAASVILIFSLGYLFYEFSGENDRIESITLLEKSNPKGQKSKLVLPDGSQVRLNADSYLRYEENTDEGQRKVYLTGEAFFDVIRDVTKPFVVYSGNISTTALGTTFNIKAYPKEANIDVYLVSGEVQVKNRNKASLTLKPGEGARYVIREDQLATSAFDPLEVSDWRNGTIRFRDASLDQVVKKLERWYGVKFEIKGAPEEAWSVNGVFQHQSLGNVLRSISYTTHFKYNISTDKVILNF